MDIFEKSRFSSPSMRYDRSGYINSYSSEYNSPPARYDYSGCLNSIQSMHKNTLQNISNVHSVINNLQDEYHSLVKMTCDAQLPYDDIKHRANLGMEIIDKEADTERMLMREYKSNVAYPTLAAFVIGTVGILAFAAII